MKRKFLALLFAASSLFAAGDDKALVSITFDDGWQSQYDQAVPILKEYGYPATFYLYSQGLGQPQRFTEAEVLDLKRAGHEIGSHSFSHPHLRTLSEKEIETELSESKNRLEKLIGGPVENFAAPYGEVNVVSLKLIKKYYKSNRSVVPGYNIKFHVEPYAIRCFVPGADTTEKQIEDQLDKAIQDQAWIVFCYHQTDESGSEYSVKPNFFRKHMEMIKKRGLSVLTIEQALKIMMP